MNENDALFAFTVDYKIKQRYKFLVLNGHITKSFMAARLRVTFLKAVNDAEAAAGMKVTDALKLKQYSDDAEELKGVEKADIDPSFVKHNLIENEPRREEGGGEVV